MNNLDKYLKEKQEELCKKDITEELEIIRYIYLDLGKRFSFDTSFIPFGNSKTKEEIYNHSKDIDDLNNCMETNKIICKSIAYILEYILKKLGVNIVTVEEKYSHIKYPHIYNYIKCKDGRKFYIDLQEDIHNIQTNSYTPNFGMKSIYNSNLIISRYELEKIDKKLEYIDDKKYYSDDYLYLLHSIADGIDSFREKAKVILENIDIVPTNKMGYIDRQWHHKNILEDFFNKDEFDYIHNSGKIKMYDCYKDINNKKKHICFILVNDNKEVDIYIYNKKENNYKKIDIEIYTNYIMNDLTIYTKRKTLY